MSNQINYILQSYKCQTFFVSLRPASHMTISQSDIIFGEATQAKPPGLLEVYPNSSGNSGHRDNGFLLWKTIIYQYSLISFLV